VLLSVGERVSVPVHNNSKSCVSLSVKQMIDRLLTYMCGGRYRCANIYLPHINSSFVDLHTEHVLSRYTALDTMESALHGVVALVRLTLLRLVPRQPEQATLPER
jgi:hypothetical protein